MEKFLTVFFLILTIVPIRGQDQPCKPHRTTQVQIGKFYSRAIWTQASCKPAPVVVLLPGSGPSGPEEMSPTQLTDDGKDHSLFGEISEPLQKAGMHTLALGKPGIEFFTAWDPNRFFYAKDLYVSLRWSDLLENVSEAISFLRAQNMVDPTRIYILGHSEGTQVAVDYAASHSGIAGLILLGYLGEDFKTLLSWQLFDRDIDFFVKSDVDANHDGIVTREEAKPWPEFRWDWKEGQESVPVDDIAKSEREQNLPLFERVKSTPLYSDGIFDRGPTYKKAAALPVLVQVFNGEIDMQTPAFWALRLKDACAEAGKKNCRVTIVRGLGHGFSPPKGPNFHPVADITVGGVAPRFQTILYKFANQLVKGAP